LRKAGIGYPGHTEIFAAYTKTDAYAMMLADEHFKVVHVSTHLSLSEAIKCVKKDRIAKVIHLANEALLSMGIDTPRVAVAGLNPHAGEGGLFGREEIDEIIPAVKQTRKEGINAEGPFPPDTIFPKMHGGQYDVVVCMYHDQGHIPMKLLGFSYNHETGQWDTVSGVNITLGLPIVRVSVDHGTAFDKGGKNTANPQSMVQAIDYAAKMSRKAFHN
jgi:4-phospho-D-threonate 3-dehydrogenase / 4-phospho-D-erythronate 3-dehydrogenase